MNGRFWGWHEKTLKEKYPRKFDFKFYWSDLMAFLEERRLEGARSIWELNFSICINGTFKFSSMLPKSIRCFLKALIHFIVLDK